MDQPGNHIPFRANQPDVADRMRELLARTVQDHVADQRSNADTLEHIRRQMEGLEWLVKEVRERELPGLTSRLDSLSQYLDEAAHKPPSWAESLAEHVDVLRIQLAPVADLRSLWTDVGTITQDVGQALPQLAAVSENITAAVEALRVQDERLGRLQQSAGKLQMSMEAAGSIA
jgi:DNA repair ATPase RecN